MLTEWLPRMPPHALPPVVAALGALWQDRIVVHAADEEATVYPDWEVQAPECDWATLRAEHRALQALVEQARADWAAYGTLTPEGHRLWRTAVRRLRRHQAREEAAVAHIGATRAEGKTARRPTQL
ncbi:MAG: hypothetical protein K6V97_13410 [Actinomycetia bacterium]|nr:hypothetical protein [Actinomycetes bacterium]